MHDAIGNHVLQARRILREAGFDSEIWADRIDDRLAREARHYLEYRPEPGNILVYQLSTDSDMAEWLEDLVASGIRLVANYHNITPSRFFRRWEPEIARRLDVARHQMAQVGPLTDFAIAVSDFNRSELDQVGYAHTAVAPLLMDTTEFRKVARGTRPGERVRSRGARWLFVGRIAPNKCQHDVVAAFAVYRRLYDPTSTLTFVGSPSSFRYLRAVRRLAADLDLGSSFEHLENIRFADLVECYKRSDVLVCLSEHEGFCAPLIEAMEMAVPVVAYRAAAVPETVVDAAVLLDSKDPFDAATAVADLLGDPRRCADMVARGASRAAELSVSATGTKFLETLTSWLNVPPGDPK